MRDLHLGKNQIQICHCPWKIQKSQQNFHSLLQTSNTVDDVDGRNPANQFRLVAYPRFFFPSHRWLFGISEPSTVRLKLGAAETVSRQRPVHEYTASQHLETWANCLKPTRSEHSENRFTRDQDIPRTRKNNHKWWFPTTSNVKILNHPIETAIKKLLFRVPGMIW